MESTWELKDITIYKLMWKYFSILPIERQYQRMPSEFCHSGFLDQKEAVSLPGHLTIVVLAVRALLGGSSPYGILR